MPRRTPPASDPAPDEPGDPVVILDEPATPPAPMPRPTLNGNAASLPEALLKAQRYAQPVAKSARNNFHGYDYAPADAVIAEARRALNLAGLLAYRHLARIVADSEPHPLLLSTFALEHPASGQTIVFVDLPYPIIEEKGRPWDKALAVALTTSLSYWLRDLLLMERDEADDAAGRDDRAHAPPTTIGPAGAGAIRRQLKAAKIDLADLLGAMAKGGIDAPTDLALWPRELRDRAETWIAARTAARSATDGAPPGPSGSP